MSTLRQGDRGPEVEALQRDLAARGHDPGPIDGVFGPKTDAAVRAYQRAHGLGVDGIVGPKTREALANDAPPAPTPPPAPPAPDPAPAPAPTPPAPTPAPTPTPPGPPSSSAFVAWVHETRQRQVIQVQQDHTRTIRLQGPRPLTVLPFDAATAFGGDGVVPWPAALAPAAVALRALAELPDASVLVAGHASEGSGADERAFTRAKAVHALLTGDHAAQAELARSRGGEADARALREGLGLPDLGVVDWSAMFALYEAQLATVAGGPAALAALRAQARWVAPGAVGCGASWPPDRVRCHGWTPARQDRVDVLFFGPQDLPALKCHAGGEGACDWKQCDVYRKGKYRALELPVFVPPAATVHMLELEARHACHDGGAAVLQPGSALDDPGGRADVAAGLAEVLRRVVETGADRVLVVAHGPGADDDLARRAQNVADLLRGPDAWARASKAAARPRDFQRILKWIAATTGWACDPGKVDDLPWGGTQKALDRFRKEYHASRGVWLAPGGQPGLADWKAFHDVITARVGALAGVDFAEVTGRLVVLGAVAAGERWPAAAVEIVDHALVHAARVDVCLFTAQDAPTDVAPPLEGLYAGGRYGARPIVAGGEPHALHALVVDDAERPIEGVPYTVFAGDEPVREGSVGPGGRIVHPLPQGVYRVEVRRGATALEESVVDDDDVPIAAPAPAPVLVGADASPTMADFEALLAGAFQRRGSYREDMKGFKDPKLDALLVSACAAAGADKEAVEEQSGASKGAPGSGDSEAGTSKGVPKWLRHFQDKAMRASAWGTQEQTYSRLLEAFYYAYFVERFYAPAGIVMPANVEYFLSLLGRSVGNGGATAANIGAGKYAYCAAASSVAFKKGNERYGFATKALGYAPEHGTKVKNTYAPKTGEANRPRPGDVLSVKTHPGPITGHVVTVVWADTDGTKDGTIWYVSGNAACKSVSCDFARVVVTKKDEKPPSGAVSVINHCDDGKLQPDRLQPMSEAELEAVNFSRMPGEFPPPNTTALVTPASPALKVDAIDPELKAKMRALLAAGEGPTTAVSAPPAPIVLRAGLALHGFEVRLLPGPGTAAATTFGPEAVTSPGRRVELRWRVQGHRTVTLWPLGRDVTAVSNVEPIVLDPLETPPDERGVYRLEASDGVKTVSAEVRVVGIFDLKLVGRARPGKQAPELLRRRMEGGHPRYGTWHYEQAAALHGLEGSFQALDWPEGEDAKHWFWGQITPKSDAELSWRVIWPDLPALELAANRKKGSLKPPAVVVDALALSARDGPFLAGSHVYESDGLFRVFFEADVRALDGAGAPLAAATLRLRENYEMPALADFSLVVGGRSFGGDVPADVAPGARPSVAWRLTGSHSRCGLELLVCRGTSDQAAGLVFAETIRPLVPDGEATPAEHKKDDGTRALSRALPAETGDYTAFLRLVNRYGKVSQKHARFRVTGGAPPPLGGCGLGPACPLRRAQELLQAYWYALDELERTASSCDKVLRQAVFASGVVQWLAKHPSKAGKYLETWDKYDESDIWERLLHRSQSGTASSYETSFLKAHIADLEGAKRGASAAAEAAAQALTSFVDAELSPHLLDLAHEHGAPHDEFMARTLGKLSTRLPETPHGRAWLLGKARAYLTAVGPEPGRAQGALAPGGPAVAPAERSFARAIALMKASAGPADAVQGLLLSLGATVAALVDERRRAKQYASLEAALAEPELRALLRLFDVQEAGRAVDVAGMIADRARHYGSRSDAVRGYMAQTSAVDDLKGVTAQFAGGMKEGDWPVTGKWADGRLANSFGVVVDSLAFAASVIKLQDEFAKVGAKDLFSLAADALTMVRSALEAQKAWRVAAGAPEKDLGGLKGSIRALNAAAAVCTAVVSAIDFYDAMRKEQTGAALVAAMAFLGATFTLVGATFTSLAAMTGIGAVLALAAAVIGMFVLDTPIVDWLELLPWGSKRDSIDMTPIDKVIDSFYELRFQLTVRFVHDEVDLDLHYIKVRLSADATAHRLLFTVSRGGTSLGTRKVYPADPRRIEGLDPERKKVVDAQPRPLIDSITTPSNTVRVYKPWLLWGLVRDGATKHVIDVTLEALDGSGALVKADPEETTFPPPPDPLIRSLDVNYVHADQVVMKGPVTSGTFVIRGKKVGPRVLAAPVVANAAGHAMWIGAYEDDWGSDTLLDQFTTGITRADEHQPFTKLWLRALEGGEEEYAVYFKAQLLDGRGQPIAEGTSRKYVFRAEP